MSEKARGYANRVDVAADPSEVWRALTESEHVARWCAPRAQVQARRGGLFRASVDRLNEFEAHIDVFDIDRRLRLIHLPSRTLPPTDNAIVDDFILDESGPGTILRLLGSGFPATAEWNALFVRQKAGWQQAMARLKVLVESQRPAAVQSGVR